MIKLNDQEINYGKFSGGEVYFKIENPEDIASKIIYQVGISNTITAYITNSDEVFVLMNLKNICKCLHLEKKKLLLKDMDLIIKKKWPKKVLQKNWKYQEVMYQESKKELLPKF